MRDDSNPFQVLGISHTSSAEQIRSAWKVLARVHHPDVGGDVATMQLLNRALEGALALCGESTTLSVIPASVHRDVSSFTVAVLPVDCYIALEIVAAICGPTVYEDPPYVLEFHLHDSPVENALYGWCRCELVPEAGATTVHLTVGSESRENAPSVEAIRDYLVILLNSIDWPEN